MNHGIYDKCCKCGEAIIGHFCIRFSNILVKDFFYYFVVPYDSLYCCLTHICYKSGKSTLDILNIYILKSTSWRVNPDSRRALSDSAASSHTDPATTLKIGIRENRAKSVPLIEKKSWF